MTNSMQKKIHIKKGDQVFVISGEYKGQKGRVLTIDREKNLQQDEQYILATDVAGEKIAVGKGHLYLARATLPVIKGRQPDPLR